MKQYVLNIYQPGATPPPRDVLDKIMRDVSAVRQAMQDAGALVFTGGLSPPSSATVVRVQDGRPSMTDGPYIESKEFVGGFTILNAPDLDAALAWARNLAAATTLPIEVRPVQGH
jgi:hypothetical protein